MTRMINSLVVCALLAASQAPALAATQYWDTVSSAGLQGGSGAWSTNAPGQWSDTSAGTALSPWVAGNVAVLGVPADGVPSTLTVTERFRVGAISNYGGACMVIVTNGGGLLQGSGASWIGLNASNNTVQVVGSPSGRSLWEVGAATPQNLTVGSGAQGTNNLLWVDGAGVAGGAVVTNVAALVLGSGNGASFNTLMLTNGGRYFGSTSAAVGNQGRNNSLCVMGGGGVPTVFDNGGAAVSLGNNNTGSTNNSLLVDGLGVDGSAVVTNVGSLYIGQTSGGGTQGFNRVTIRNYGRMYASAETWVGRKNGWNTLVVTNGGRFSMVGTAANNQLKIGYDGGYGSASNQMWVTGPDSVVDLAGGSLLVGTGGSLSNLVMVDNGGVVSNAAVSVGYGVSTNNSMVVSAGSKVYSTVASSIGAASGTVANSVLVTGDGSLWNLNGQSLALGLTNSFNNTLTIDQGGVVDNVGVLSNNVNGSVNLSGGTLGVVSTAITNGLPTFVVGDGAQPATLKALGGTLNFTNGLVVNPNGSLIGTGTVLGGTTGVILTNRATMINATGAPSAGLTLGSLTWYGGATNVVDITSLTGAGVGWDLLTVTGAMTVTNASPALVVRLDSLGQPAANFNASMDYNLRIVNYGSLIGFAPGSIVVDLSTFQNAYTGTWGVSNLNGALYITYRGSGSYYTPTSKWNDPNSGNWSVGSNWTPSGVPSSGGSTVLEFSGNGTSYTAANDLGTFPVNKLLLTGGGSSTVTNTVSGNALVLTNTGARVDYSGSGSYQLSALTDLKGTAVFGGNGLGGSVVLPSNITGTGGLLKQGSWTLSLSGSNAFGGPVVVDSVEGVLRCESTNALGTANDVVVSNGTLWSTSGSIAAGRGASNRRILVTGLSSVWTSSVALIIASGNATNVTVTVADGAQAVFGLGSSLAGATAFNTMVVTNGGRVLSAGTTYIGQGGNGSNNTMLVTGQNSVYTNGGGATLYIGGTSGGNIAIADNGGLIAAPVVVHNQIGTSSLLVTNGGRFSGSMTVANSPSIGCVGKVLVTGSNSVARLNGSAQQVARYGTTGSVVAVTAGGVITNGGWLVAASTTGMWNSVVVSNAGQMWCSAATIVASTNCSNNSIMVSDSGSYWNNGGKDLTIAAGTGATSNSVVVTAGGTLTNVATFNLAGQATAGAGNNVLVVDGGVFQAARLTCSNDMPNSVTINGAAMVTLGGLVLSNAGQMVLFKGGTLNLTSSFLNNGQPQVVGDGAQGATLNVLAGGRSRFVDGLVITNGATLAGNGLCEAATTVHGVLNPGVSGIGVLTNSGSLNLRSGAVSTFEIYSNTGMGAGCDGLVVSNGTLTLGGKLAPVLMNGFTPTVSDRFVIITNTVPLGGGFNNAGGGFVAVTASNTTHIEGYFWVDVGSQYVALDHFGPSPMGTLIIVQ